jgi:hypothetical protein
MTEHDAHSERVKKLLAQDPEINETQLKEFRMNLEVTLQNLEAKATRARRGIMIAAITYLTAMILFVASGAASNSIHTGWLGLTYRLVMGLGFAASWIALVVGVWLVLTYFYRYAPGLKRARFDVQTAMIVELQEQMAELRRALDQRGK